MLIRSLRWYWRTNAAVIGGVAVAVSVLAGSLLVGDSVRASLRRLALERLGHTEAAVLGTGFFREALAADAAAAAQPAIDVIPLIAVEGLVAHPSSGRRAANVQVLGVDDRFWRFHEVEGVSGPAAREAFLSADLARELGAEDGDGVLIRVRQASEIPAGVLQGRRDDLSQSLRASAVRVLSDAQLGSFSLSLGQGAVRSIFLPLERLQREIRKEREANLLLARGDGAALRPDALRAAMAGRATLADAGLSLRPAAGSNALVLESRTGFVSPAWQAAVERAVQARGWNAAPVLTYIANTIRVGSREVPYSVVVGLDLQPEQVQSVAVAPAAGAENLPAIHLNAWAARELAPSADDIVTLEYFVWSDAEGLATREARFRFAGIVPMDAAGGDRTLTPEYPGMTDAPQIGDWDPPFPVDLGRIRPRDEQYWDEYRAAPKAFVRYAEAQRLWASRFGDVTSLRLAAPASLPLDRAEREISAALTDERALTRSGLEVHPVRERALAAARGTTDFGEYFVYFSFFLFVSGLILAVLFFRLGIEQRSPEIGLLQALGFTDARIRRLFLAEGAVLAAAGALAGVPGAVLFCSAILLGLRTWWVGAVGTDAIALAINPWSLAVGAVAGIAAALATIYFSLRALRHMSARALIAGASPAASASGRGAMLAGVRYPMWVGVCLLVAAVLLVAGATGAIGQEAAFFGAGTLLLAAAVLAFSWRLRRPVRSAIHRPGVAGVFLLGARQTRWRPARSVLVAALIGAATFVIVAVGAFRRDTVVDARAPQSGTGGFPLWAESVMPLMHDPSTPAGRSELGFSQADEAAMDGVRITRFRLRPGDEASCLNLYQPGNPRILAPPAGFEADRRFAFSSVMSGSADEQANPWLLLDRAFDDGAVPVIGDATSLTYVLHRGVGDDIEIPGENGEPIVLRVVAALSHSMLQSELIVSERQFVRLFPRREGYRFFLIDAAAEHEAAVSALLEERLADAGFDVQSSVERLRAYERVERTYLATFQTLGGLGLMLGTIGLGAVLLRNVLERRRELALLRVVGYRAVHVRGLVLAESLLVLGAGVAAGTASALVAVAPALWTRGGGGPGWGGTAALLGAVAAAGVLSSIVAARAATRAAPASALRSE